ncbi:MAG TPA: hypothetical protein VFS60_14560, partial [Thermoanaerobaculia bacterium]|nr:hypothetical protein [Thermoanaerobaculia bacterium]
MSEATRHRSRAGRRAAALLAFVALLLGGAVSRAATDRASTDTPAPVASHAHHHGAGATPATAPRADSDASKKPSGATPAYTGDRAETERLVAYDKAIQLTAAQEAIRVEALTPLAAPCCKQFSAATCCCRCNMKRASDGLAKHLIVNLGANAETVRAQVAAWQKAINPDGFSGDTCSTGGCGRAFQHNGCG